MTSKSTSSRVAVGLIAGLLALIAFALWQNQSARQSTGDPAQLASVAPAPNPPAADTVASAWQWQNMATMTERTMPTPAKSASEDLPFNAEAIYDALQDVRIDPDGNVVLDHQALEALNKTFKHGQIELTDPQLTALQELIQVGLPGKAGEQAAQIVGDFYQYLEAKEGFEAAHRPLSPDRVPSDTTIKQQYEELRALRSTYLGQTVAEKLFAREDAAAEYMFKAREIQADPGLTPEQKVRRAEQLGQELLKEPTPTQLEPTEH